MSKLELVPGSGDWKKLRHKARNDLYWLNAKVLGHEEVVPMTYRAHYAMCRFAERKTGIPDIDGCRVQLIQVPRGVGKALALDTPLPTPMGWTTMGNVKVGDEVLSQDGTPTEVVWKSPIYVGNKCYKVCFNEGSEIVADADHLWVVQDKNSRNRKNGKNIIVTTEELKRDVISRSGSRPDLNFIVETVSPLDLPGGELPIPPYVLGAWLGDGTSANGSFTSKDQEIIEEIRDEGYTVTNNKTKYRFHIHGLIGELRKLGVLNNKHIPTRYLRASEQQRRDLLAGLLDTDGGVANKSSTTFFYNTNKRLVDEVIELVASLGYQPRVSEKQAQLNGKDCGKVWTVTFRPLEQVFRLARKAERLDFGVSQLRRHTHRTVTAVEDVETVPVACIAVDASSRQYLAGHTMIPTHNSTCVTKGRTIQLLLQDKEASVGIANERQDNANGFLGMIKMEFESNELLQALFPDWIPDFKKTEWRSDRIVINRDKPNPVNPSVLATGVGGTVTGVHMDTWIVDDLISQDAAENARAGHFTEIEKANRWVQRLQPLLKNPKRDNLTFIGTPWYKGDTYEFLEEYFGKDEEPQEFLWSLDLPDGDQQKIRLLKLGELAVFRLPAINENGRALFPERYDLEELESMRLQDPIFFAGQYMLKPSAGGAADFKPEWLNTFEWEKMGKQVRYKKEGKTHFSRVRDMQVVISIDPAMSRRKEADRSAIVVTGTDGEQLFLLESWAKRVGATDLASKALQFYFQYRPYRIVVETVAYQEALAEVLTLLADEHNVDHRLPIYEHKTGSKSKKDVRILGLEPYFKKGIFYYNPSQQEFYDEYISYPFAKHRDILDALSFQRDVWDRLFERVETGSTRLREWQNADAERANKVKAALSRRRRR